MLQFLNNFLDKKIEFSIGGMVISTTIGIIFITLIAKAWNSGKILELLSRAFVFFRRSYVKFSIKKSIQSIFDTEEIRSLSPNRQKVKVKIQKEIKIDDFDNEECIVVAVESDQNNGKSVALATIQAVSQSLFPYSAKTLKQEIEKSVSFALAKKAFSSNRMIAANKYFELNILPTEYKTNPNFETIMSKLEDMDRLGLFSKVLVRQYFEVNRKQIDSYRFSQIQSETEDFLKFVHAISIREEFDKKTPLKFHREFIKVRVVLVSSSVAAAKGADGVIGRLNLDKNSDHVYLVFPSINRSMIERNHIPTWDLYADILEKIKKGECSFALAGEPKTFFVPGKDKRFKIKVAVLFLERNL